MKKIGLALMILAVAAMPGRASEDAKAVDKIVRSMVDSVLEVLQDDSLERPVKRKKVLEIVNPVFDFRLMAKLSLGRKHWPKFGKKERAEFTDVFIEQLRESYVEKIDLFTDETVEYSKPQAAKKKFRMLTHVISKDKRYAMLYKLYKKKGAWKVYDLEIEKISIIKSYGAQYDQFLRAEGNTPADLIAKLKQRAPSEPKKSE